jgi:hypothetical protein
MKNLLAVILFCLPGLATQINVWDSITTLRLPTNSKIILQYHTHIYSALIKSPAEIIQFPARDSGRADTISPLPAQTWFFPNSGIRPSAPIMITTPDTAFCISNKSAATIFSPQKCLFRPWETDSASVVGWSIIIKSSHPWVPDRALQPIDTATINPGDSLKIQPTSAPKYRFGFYIFPSTPDHILSNNYAKIYHHNIQFSILSLNGRLQPSRILRQNQKYVSPKR